jgi:hypothetical protein
LPGAGLNRDREAGICRHSPHLARHPVYLGEFLKSEVLFTSILQIKHLSCELRLQSWSVAEPGFEPGEPGSNLSCLWVDTWGQERDWAVSGRAGVRSSSNWPASKGKNADTQGRRPSGSETSSAG